MIFICVFTLWVLTILGMIFCFMFEYSRSLDRVFSTFCALLLTLFILSVYHKSKMKECRIYSGNVLNYSVLNGCLFEYQGKTVNIHTYKKIITK